MSCAIRYQPDTARRVLVVANPSAGSGANRSAINELLDRLRASGIQPELTSDLNYAARLGGDPGSTGMRAVVAAGGDARGLTVRATDTVTMVLPGAGVGAGGNTGG